MMQFSMLAQPVNKGWTIYTPLAVTLCVGNPRILLLDAYKVTWNTGKIDLLKGEKSRMEEQHSIRTIHKTTLEHLLNFKCTIDSRAMISNHHLGFLFGNSNTRIISLDR